MAEDTDAKAELLARLVKALGAENRVNLNDPDQWDTLTPEAKMRVTMAGFPRPSNPPKT